MYVGAALSGLGLVVGLATRSKIRAAVVKAEPHATASSINTSFHVAVVSVVLGGLLGVGLWIWMAIANARGHNWARITGTVFFGLNTLGLLVSFIEHTTLLGRILGVLVWLAGFAAVLLLWRPESTVYFTRPGYPGYPGQSYP